MGNQIRVVAGPRRWAGRALAATIGVLVMFMFGGAGAVAAPVAAPIAVVELGDSVYVGERQGYAGTGMFPVWASTPADLDNPGEPDLWAYCVEHEVGAEVHRPGIVGDLGSYLGENRLADPGVLELVHWVLANGYPALTLEEFGAAAGVDGLARNDAIEAVQYAIWRYTELDFDAPWHWTTPQSEQAYWYLVNGANGAAETSVMGSSVEVSIAAPADTQVAGGLVGPFVVNSNQPTVAVTVETDGVAADPVATVATDAAGAPIDLSSVVDGQEIFLDLRESAEAGSATLSVEFRGSPAAGAIVSVANELGGSATVADHAQTLMLVAASGSTSVVRASVTWDALEGGEVPGPGGTDEPGGTEEPGGGEVPVDGGVDPGENDGEAPGHSDIGEPKTETDVGGGSLGRSTTETGTALAATGGASPVFFVYAGVASVLVLVGAALFVVAGSPAARRE